MSYLYMPSIKIAFTKDDHDFMTEYKESTGVSIQHFVTVALQKHITDIKAQRVIDDADTTIKYTGEDED